MANNHSIKYKSHQMYISLNKPFKCTRPLNNSYNDLYREANPKIYQWTLPPLTFLSNDTSIVDPIQTDGQIMPLTLYYCQPPGFKKLSTPLCLKDPKILLLLLILIIGPFLIHKTRFGSYLA